MKALYKYAPGARAARLEEHPAPQLTPRDNVFIRVSVCAVSAADLQIYQGKFSSTPPFIMGHEFVGEVESVFPGVTAVAPGDRVTVHPYLYACCKCQSCRDGFPQYCEKKQFLGVDRDGTLAEYITLPEESLHKIPASLPDNIACLAAPMAALAGDILSTSLISPRETVLIIGSGQSALLALIAAKAGGAARVIVAGVTQDRPVRFPAAKALGADLVVDTLTQDLSAVVLEETGGLGAHLAIETTGTEAGVNNAIDCLRVGGRMACLGLSQRESIAAKWDTAMEKFLTLRFFHTSDYREMDRALQILEEYPRDLKPLVTHPGKLEDWERVFDTLSRGGGITGVLRIRPL